MAQRDTVDKIVQSYFAAVTRVPFTYKGKHYAPKRLAVSPLLFRGFTCPAGCGGCCPRFSLDYLPSEPHPREAQPRVVHFDGREVRLKSILQERGDHHCSKLDMDNGRCTIHGYHPFSCDFELIRSLISGDDKRSTFLTQKLYGRGWAMLRVDGERGALCEMTPADAANRDEVVRKLERLQCWTSAFGLITHVPTILEWAQSGPHNKPLELPF